jgi:oligosaccharyltransferase complex subunit alpha (ribophorin I)
MLIRSLLVLSCVVAGALSLDAVNKDLTVTNVDRTIDLASQLVKISTKVTLNNGGQSPVKSFHFVVDESAVDKVDFVGATVSSYSEMTVL